MGKSIKEILIEEQRNDIKKAVKEHEDAIMRHITERGNIRSLVQSLIVCFLFFFVIGGFGTYYNYRRFPYIYINNPEKTYTPFYNIWSTASFVMIIISFIFLIFIIRKINEWIIQSEKIKNRTADLEKLKNSIIVIPSF